MIRLANKAGVVLVPFDNVLDTDEVMQVNEDQLEMGKIMGRWLTKHVGTSRARSSRSAACRATRSTATAISASARSWKRPATSSRSSRSSATGTTARRRRSTADAIAVHGQFDGMFVQGGSTGAVRALMDAGHPFIPVAGEAENGFRKLCAEHAKDGLLGSSAGQSPGLVAIAMKAAISALQGKAHAAVDLGADPADREPGLQGGRELLPDLTDNFFTPNEFPPCGVNITAPEIMAQERSQQLIGCN